MSTAAKTIQTANIARKVLPARVARRVVTSRTARRAISAAILARVLDPTGKRRAARQRQRLIIAGAASGALLAIIVTAIQRRRSRARTAADEAAAAQQGQPRTAGTTDVRGNFRSRHGEGAGALAGTTPGPMPPSTAGPRSGRPDGGPLRSPLDTLAAHAEHLQNQTAEEPGFHGHLGFGIGGSIPTGRVGDAFPTAGGDALGGTVRGDEAGDADEIVTGAGQAISNSTTPSQNGTGNTIH